MYSDIFKQRDKEQDYNDAVQHSEEGRCQIIGCIGTLAFTNITGTVGLIPQKGRIARKVEQCEEVVISLAHRAGLMNQRCPFAEGGVKMKNTDWYLRCVLKRCESGCQ